MPFRVRRNVLHHAKSALKDALIQIWCHGFLAGFASTIIHLNNERPGFITLVACWSWPISKSNSSFVQDFLPSQLCSSVSSRCSFSSSSLISPFVVSNSNPWYSRQVWGPSHFSDAKGTPSNSHMLVMIWQLQRHSSEPAAPAVIKSSK